MRVFIAIALPKEIKDSLAALQGRLRSYNADVKWVRPCNIHLTLKFLGEISPEKLNEVAKSAQESLNDKPKFTIAINTLGVFPDVRYPKVIWAGIEKGDREARMIAALLEEGLEKLGIPKEKKEFSSHITLGRARSLINKDNLIGSLDKLKDELRGYGLEFVADRVTLFKSTLAATGPVYETLKEVALNAA